jgi:hypothetical protein
MRKSARPHVTFAWPVTALLAAFSLSACGGADEKAGQKVEMRDMEVVDGTINDAMTDLDAARTDGTALAGNNAGANAAQPGQRTSRRTTQDEVDEPEQDAEAVAVE